MIEQFLQPRGFRRALRLKARWGADGHAVAGGTDLMVKVRAGRAAPRAVIDLSRTGLGFIRRSGEWVVIGATASAGDFLRLPWARGQAPALYKACLMLGGPQIQNGATFAGNLANASPAADKAQARMALGAQVGVESLARGGRWMGVEEFLLGPGRTALAADELIREIRFPRSSLVSRGASRRRVRAGSATGGTEIVSDFYKMGPRRAQVISVACLAGWAEREAGGARPRVLRLAAGGVAPRTVRLRAAEDFILTRGVSSEVVRDAADLALLDIAPISDVRGSADYKALLIRNFTRTFLESLLPGGNGEEGAR